MKFYFILIFIISIIVNPVAFAQTTPDWVKNTAGWWATDAISENEFVNAIEFLVNEGIIHVITSQTEKNIEFCLTLQNDLGINQNIQNELCNDFFNTEYSNISRFPSPGLTITHNSHDFRGPEFNKNKSDNTFRIFLVGESTTYGSMNDETKTIRHFLQENYNESYPTLNIEIINAGLPSNGNSLNLTNLVKEKIVKLSPDLLIIHNTIQDMANQLNSPDPVQDWYDRWKNVCDIGKTNGFDVIITVQPFNGTGNKILGQDEIRIYTADETDNLIIQYQPFIEKLNHLRDYCSSTVDLSTVFDKIQEDIFIDNYHFGDKGSKIIADAFFEISRTNVENYYKIQSEKPQIQNIELEKAVDNLLQSNYSLVNMNFENLNLENRNFSGKDLSGSTFYNTILENSNFQNANLKNVNILGSVLQNSNFQNAILSGSNIINSDLINANLKNANLSNSFLFHLEFIDVNLSKTSFSNSKIIDSNFNNSDLSDIQFTNTDFYMTDTIFDLNSLDNEDSKNTVTYKPILQREQYDETINTTQDDGLFLVQTIWQFKMSSEVNFYDSLVKYDNLLLYNQISLADDEQNAVVIFPEASLFPYSKPCIWDYYIETTSDCFTIPMLRESEKTFQYYDGNTLEEHIVDFTKPSPLNYHPFWQRSNNQPDEFLFTANLLSESSNLGAQALALLDYPIISDLEIEIYPKILSNYDKVIVLHNKYVTKTMFDSIINHPKVVYLYPDSLSEEITIDFSKNTINVLNPLKFPQEKNFQNDFQWEFASEHLKYENCISDNFSMKFEKVKNGIMLNCYPESNFAYYSPDLFKIIKEF